MHHQRACKNSFPATHAESNRSLFITSGNANHSELSREYKSNNSSRASSLLFNTPTPLHTATHTPLPRSEEKKNHRSKGCRVSLTQQPSTDKEVIIEKRRRRGSRREAAAAALPRTKVNGKLSVQPRTRARARVCVEIDELGRD